MLVGNTEKKHQTLFHIQLAPTIDRLCVIKQFCRCYQLSALSCTATVQLLHRTAREIITYDDYKAQTQQQVVAESSATGSEPSLALRGAPDSAPQVLQAPNSTGVTGPKFH
jgi:hypothetical protein